MRKYIYALTALLAVLLASCSNDDIAVTYSQQLTYNVSTQKAFDTFKTTDDIKRKVLSGNYQLGVYTFIYDEDGKLVVADSTYYKTFGQEARTYTLTDGDYTAITAEMIVNDKLRSPLWFFAGQDNLSTLEIRRDTAVNAAYWFSSVGYSDTTITVRKAASQTVSVTPEAIGSLFRMRARRFDQYASNYYTHIIFCTPDAPIGRYLSPDKSGSDRFHYDTYNKEHRWDYRGVIDLPVDSDNVGIDVYLLESGSITYCMGPVNSAGRFTAYPSSDAKYTVDDGGTVYAGLAYAGTEGCYAGVFTSTGDYSAWYAQLPSVTVMPDAKPYLTWGASAATVHEYMMESGMAFLSGDTDSTEYSAVYYNPARSLVYFYDFDTSQNNLNTVSLRYSKSGYKLSDILAALSGEYSFKGRTDNGDYIYVSDDTYVGAYENSSYVYVIYISMKSSAKKNYKLIRHKC